MIYSMTGYGQTTAEVDQVSYAVEIRTVNNRYFKANIRLPESVSFLEDKIDKVLRSGISRGMVNYTLRMKNFSSEEQTKIDTTLLKNYFQQITDAFDEKNSPTVNVSELLLLPGVLQPIEPDPEQAEKIRRAAIDITAQTIEKVKQMRQQEGKALVDDMLKHCSVIAEKLEIIEPRIESVVAEYHDKLKKRIDQLLSTAKLKIDEQLLIRETAIFAERCDIAEEIARLNSHLKQFEQTCNNNGNAGKKLDFITQEMLREANTIASKASDSLIAQSVVDIKCSIERLKEQVQNIE